VDPPLLITNLPASVCVQCGEQTYSTRTLNALKRIRDGDGPDPALRTMLVFDFEEIEHGNKPRVGEFELPRSLVIVASTSLGVPSVREVGPPGERDSTVKRRM
jgi:hypothetical protein